MFDVCLGEWYCIAFVHTYMYAYDMHVRDVKHQYSTITYSAIKSTVLTKHNACDKNQLLKSSGQKIFLPNL